MRYLLSFLLSLIFFQGHAATTLSSGDLVIIHYNALGSTTNSLALVSRVFIEAGTQIHITNRTVSSTAGAFSAATSDQGTISILFTEDLSIGQVFTVSFAVAVTNPTVSSTFGSVSFSGNEFDFGNSPAAIENIWVYQGTSSAATSASSFITAVSWKDAPATVPSTINYTPGSTQNAIALGINGASDKCGCWTQYTTVTNNTTAMTSVVFSNTLNLTFYKLSQWIFSTSNSTNSTLNINPCSPTNVYSFLNTNIAFTKYRYGRTPSQWEAFNYGTSTWTTTTAPNWTSDTRDKEVILYDSFELGTFNAGAPAQSTYECAVLTLVDSVNNNVTLTLTAGNVLRPYYGVSMVDKNTGTAGSPSLHLKSAAGTNAKIYYAQIAPTSAPLNGTYTYDVYISKAGWHHLTSPIQSTLQAVTPVTQGAGSLFAFDYTGGTTGFPNVFHWIGDDINNTFWDTVRGHYNFHDRAYAINFAANQVPVILRVTGAARITDQDLQSQETAVFGTGVSSSPGWGAPGWTSGITYNGWNFYGNPFLSFASARLIQTHYGSSQGNLASSVYVWQPMKNNLSNGQNYYTHNGSTGDKEAIHLPPFQAFFMQNQGTATGSGGLVVGKKMRFTNGSSDSSITRKTQNSSEEYALSIIAPGMIEPERIYLDPNTEMAQWSKSLKNDAPFSGNTDAVFALIFDSTLYKIKRTPVLSEDSVLVPLVVSYSNHGGIFTIANYYSGNDYTSYLVDKKTGQRQDLTNQNYSFVNDTTFLDSRFTWVLKSNSLGTSSSLDEQKLFEYRQSGSSVNLIALGSENIELFDLFSLTGSLIASHSGYSNREVSFDASHIPPGIYFVTINERFTFKILIQ
jgi:hypothetical protein